MAPRIGELFAGYGGLGMGVKAVLGGEVAWVSDTEGTRSNLWVAMREAIAQLRPRLVVWENVRGAYSAAADSALEPCPGCVGDGSGVHLRALGRVLGDLSDLGYVGGWHGLRAADVGAPHGRFRVFVVAYPEGDTRWLQYRDGGAAGHAASLGRDGWKTHLSGTLDESAGNDSGALLPSPRTSDTNGAGQHGDGGLDLRTAVAMLPTPRATDGTKGGPNQRGSSGDLMLPSAVALLPTPQVQDERHSVANAENRAEQGRQIQLAHAIGALLPTPAVNDMGEGKTPDAWDEWTAKMQAAQYGNGNGHGKSLAIEAQRLLPTTTVQDARASGGNPDTTGTHGTTLTDATVRQPDRWGQYAPAIARWEALIRPAPAPTELSAKGSPRLSARFSEWLMGLPDGWVTDVPGITRNEALKACGNGVVPQQAEAAIRWLLARIEAAA